MCSRPCHDREPGLKPIYADGRKAGSGEWSDAVDQLIVPMGEWWHSGRGTWGTGMPPAAKIDLKRVHRALFSAPAGRFVPVEVPRLTYLMVDGHGDPNSAPAYRTAVEGLYATAYAIKFAEKAADRDFVVPPLEGLWSARDPAAFTARAKHEWDWTMMIMLPDTVDEAAFAAGRDRAAGRIACLPASLRLGALKEGLCLQALHVGSYDEEGPLLARLHDEIMPAGGYDFAGPHHEIYLSDPRRVAPERLKTLLRQPVRRVDG